ARAADAQAYRVRRAVAQVVDHAVLVLLVPADVAALVEELPAELEGVRTAGQVVLEVADRAGVLVATPLVQPVTAAADDLVGREVLIADALGVAVQPEVVAELPGAELREHVLAQRAVPLAHVR